MPPRTGRPPIDNPKSVKMNIRLTETTAEDLKECAEKLNTTRISIIEKGIQLVKESLESKK